MDYVDDESDPAMLRKRKQVYKEMVETECVFIDDLKIILDVRIFACACTCTLQLQMYSICFLLNSLSCASSHCHANGISELLL